MVTETLVDEGTLFISEKIWKPIGHCQPFILAGPAGTLKYIRERYNFKTFHPFIDETYDSVEDDLQRINLICDEIEKFSKKTKEEKNNIFKPGNLLHNQIVADNLGWLRKKFKIKASQIPRNEAYLAYAAVTREAAQRSPAKAGFTKPSRLPHLICCGKAKIPICGE